MQCAAFNQQSDPTSTNVVAPQDILAEEPAPPILNSPTISSTAGNLAAGNYYYCVTAFSNNEIDGSSSRMGETLPSNNIGATVTSSGSSVTLQNGTGTMIPIRRATTSIATAQTTARTQSGSTVYSLISEA